MIRGFIRLFCFGIIIYGWFYGCYCSSFQINTASSSSSYSAKVFSLFDTSTPTAIIRPSRRHFSIHPTTMMLFWQPSKKNFVSTATNNQQFSSRLSTTSKIPKLRLSSLSSTALFRSSNNNNYRRRYPWSRNYNNYVPSHHGSSTLIWVNRNDENNHLSSHSSFFTTDAPLSLSSTSTCYSTNFCIHVMISKDDYPDIEILSAESVIDQILLQEQQRQQHEEEGDNRSKKSFLLEASLCGKELIELGSVWYLPKSATAVTPQFDTNRNNDDDDYVIPRRQDGIKPVRLLNPNCVLQDGDYLRIHPNPRRFLDVYKYNWDDEVMDGGSTNGDNGNLLPGIIVECNDTKGYVVINKPAMIPVHMTVDNCRENVAACMKEARIKKWQMKQLLQQPTMMDGSNDVYVSTPQRLDQNTSGLLVVSTSKLFAQYYAKLLRRKTEQLLVFEQRSVDEKNGIRSSSSITAATTTETTPAAARIGGIHKLYRCLICLMTTTTIPPGSTTKGGSSSNKNAVEDVFAVNSGFTSIEEAANKIRSYVETGKVMKHYLEPSIRAPKRFVTTIPNEEDESIADVDRMILDNERNTDKIKDQPQQPQQQWAECLLRITNASNIYPLIGNAACTDLTMTLWDTNEIDNNADCTAIGNDRILNIGSRRPKNCHAVMEIEIELLTGRTHQIRGQLSASGFPLVGDAQYGGVNDDSNENNDDETITSSYSDQLALQCCRLEFLDPEIISSPPKNTFIKKNQKRASVDSSDDADEQEILSMSISQRWNRFYLDEAWWTSALRKYDNDVRKLSQEDMTTAISDVQYTIPSSASSEEKDQDDDETIQSLSSGRSKTYSSGGRSRSSVARPDLLPERIQLSPGKNKYVLIRATHPNDSEVQWFVRSASPEECGGPYHGNVAQDLREWIEAVGYTVAVTGGGRIDYRPNENMAVVYGFSYGFGKGDHAFASSLINKWTNGTIRASYDNSEGLY